MPKTRRVARSRLAAAGLPHRLRDRSHYERRLAALQLRLLQIQQAYFRQGCRGIVLLEGWDAAGKGGVVRRIAARLDPRFLKVWPIAAPSETERRQHYLQRFWARLPEEGHIAVFDRSWYGRVLVERVERLTPPGEWRRAYDEINAFERLLAADGIRVVKLFLHITPRDQLARFAQRMRVPYKRWKLTRADLDNHLHRQAYARAIEDMLRRTSSRHAPWHVVAMTHQWYGRVAALARIAEVLGRGVDLAPPPVAPEIRRRLKVLLRAVRRRSQ